MTKLKYLDLTANNLNVIAEGALEGLNLEYLYLESNPTIKLPDTAFRGMSTEVLNLAKCDLTDPKPAIFRPLLSNLRKIFLEENKIERFDPAMLDIFSSIESAKIYGNPLRCDCESKWLKEFYDLNTDTNKLRDPNKGTQQEPRCATPSYVAGQFFNRLSVADFSCDKPTLHASVSFTNKKGYLSCVSRGDPLPTVSWHRPNGVIASSPPQVNMVINNNTIELLAGEPSIQGQYRCVATNDGGNISLTVNIEWPFQTDSGAAAASGQPCLTDSSTQDIIIPVGGLMTSGSNEQSNVFQEELFTLVDLIGAILGTFISTLVITVVTLHFCVYRRKHNSQYATPPMSEYSSSSNGSVKNAAYPMTLHHSLPPPHMHTQRPLPSKPYHKVYDENHYMATNIEERDEFLRISGQSSHGSTTGRMTPSTCEFCPSCRTLPHQPHHHQLT